MRSLALVTVLCLTPSIAAADLPPPAGYVETCDPSYFPGARCEVCATWHSDERPCAQRAELAGMASCCRSYGASSWSEVWCEAPCPAPTAPRAAAAESPRREAAGEDGAGGGCALSRPRAAAPGLLGLAAIAAILGARRRRSAR